jgi:hypothetical protein
MAARVVPRLPGRKRVSRTPDPPDCTLGAEQYRRTDAAIGRAGHTQRSGLRERRTLGTRPGISPYRHGPGTVTSRASGRRCTTAACRATECSSLPSSIRERRSRCRSQAEPVTARRRPSRPVPRPLAQGGATWAWPGMKRRARGLQPLGTGRRLSNEAVSRVAQRPWRTLAQVLLRWCLQQDIPVISKSTHRERIPGSGLPAHGAGLPAHCSSSS